jgi:murein L,D-transpeptidase YcbB/YkuD
VDFTLFDEDTFPFEMKQTPSTSNALGLVKFMFPNRHNIYLHDTPHKALFMKEQRTFSHGCIRLQKPFEFAYALLALQSEDPFLEFQSALETGQEITVALAQPVPIHIIYRTAVSTGEGRMGYRRDIYGRDALIFTALSEAGVAIRQNQG